MRAIILSGGKGVRLRPLTFDCPKPLVHLRGRPIIDYIVEHLTSHGVSNITLAAGYKQEMLAQHFSNSSVSVVDTGDEDIARRISQLDDGSVDPILVLYGDTLSNVSISALLQSHHSSQRPATVTVWPLKSHFGLFTLDQHSRVETYSEKPVLNYWINIGYFVLSRQALDIVRDSPTFELALSTLVSSNALNAFQHHGLHITVNSRADLEDAEAALENWNSVA